MPVFETEYDGRTFAGADASIFVFVDFMSFFLKPLSVTLPYAARFTDGETASRARERIQRFSESANRDSDEAGEVAALARFSLSLPTADRCRTSEQQMAGDGRGQKKANEGNQTSISPF